MNEHLYSGENFPLKITIYEEKGRLRGQAEGRPSFPLEGYESNKFKFNRVGLKLEFDPARNRMTFKQGLILAGSKELK